MDHNSGTIEAVMRHQTATAPWHFAQTVLIALALFGWLAWSRYLHYREMTLLKEGAGAWPQMLDMRERWRIRWGMLAGIMMLAVGVGMLVPILAWGPTIMSTLGTQGTQDKLTGIAIRASLVGVGSFAVCAGAAVLVAHIIWARTRRSVCAPPVLETNQEEV